MTKRKRPPEPSRPRMPASYGIPQSAKGLLPWRSVAQRLEAAHNYWVATTRPDGRPHVMPVWGIWTGAAFCFATDRDSRKARNLASNPAVVVHLESGGDVVIVEGVAREVCDPSELTEIDEAYFRKYETSLSGHPGDVAVYSVAPRVVFAWREKDFPQSATRWLFSETGRRRKAPAAKGKIGGSERRARRKPLG